MAPYPCASAFYPNAAIEFSKLFHWATDSSDLYGFGLDSHLLVAQGALWFVVRPHHRLYGFGAFWRHSWDCFGHVAGDVAKRVAGATGSSRLGDCATDFRKPNCAQNFRQCHRVKPSLGVNFDFGWGAG